jgi:pimeloyl-ACP methyl ester carboxylesterase
MGEPMKLYPLKDEIFRNVPREELDEFLNYQNNHPFKQIKIMDYNWEYIVGGSSDKTVLLLSGGLRRPFFGFKLIQELEKNFKVISPAYPRISSIHGLIEGIKYILEVEKITSCILIGSSFGGILSQCFLHEFPAIVEKMIIGNTGTSIKDIILRNKQMKSFKRALKVMSIFPKTLIRWISFKQFSKIFKAPEGERKLYEALIKNAIKQGLVDKQDLICHFECLIDFGEKYLFDPNDLKDWTGKLLIIKSDDDAGVGKESSSGLFEVYPNAEYYTFRGAGHVPAFSCKEEYYALINKFLGVQ